ncbi:MAG: 3',5'-cyclic-nucleotide phosphodiesterase [Ginsengibacter sp.]
MFRHDGFLTVIYFLLFLDPGFSQVKNYESFRIVPLGVMGGIDESNLSAYMVAASGTNSYICLDAGTLHYGIEKAIGNKVFSIPAEQVIEEYIKGYLISHAHLDHVAGLIINSPNDTNKNIYALASCIQTLKTCYFTWESWANFGDEGEAPLLKKYHYRVLSPDTTISITTTGLTVNAFPLSHAGIQSTAFLINNKDTYILYLGDTGPDEIEKSQNLHILWQAVAPLIKNKKLKGIFIESSFPDEQPDKILFGHLTPHWLMKEMEELANVTGKDALLGFNIIITHTKPPQINIDKIKVQLKAENTLKLSLVFPEQGKAFDL